MTEEYVFDNKFNLDYLNSYYNKYGKILLKNERGKYPRPTVTQSIKYRSEIEKHFIDFLKPLDKEGFSDKLILDIYTAINHEMQHQELMVYDFQHYFNRFPEEGDKYCPKKRSKKMPIKEKINREMVDIAGGIFELGYNGKGFCYDNELPENKNYLNPYHIDNSLVTNGDFMQFIEDGGYANYRYWLADGWDLVQGRKLALPTLLVF